MLLKPITLNSENGLPNEQVHAVTQDSLQRLWIASPAGLVRYNGNDIRIFDTNSGLECLGLRTLTVSKDGLVWMGTDKGLEILDTDGSKKEFIFDFEWTFGIAESISIDEDKIWIGTSNELLTLNRSNDILSIDRQLDVGLVTDILHIGGSKTLLVSAKHGLIIFNGNDWRIFNPELPVGDAVRCVKQTIDKFFLVGTTEGLFILEEEGNIIDQFKLSEENQKIDAIAISGDEWWLACSKTLVLAAPNSSGIEIKETLELKSRINDLFIDDINNVWIATNNSGLKKITCLRAILHEIDCDVGGPVFCVKDGVSPNELLVTGDGFCSLVKRSVDSKHVETRLISEFSSIVWNVCIDPKDENTLWYATQDGLFTSTDGSKPKRFIEEGNIIDIPNRVLITRNNEIWLGTIGGLFRIEDNIIEEVLKSDGNKFGYVYTFCLSNEGKLLVGTLGQGLWQETDMGFIPMKNEPFTESGNTYSIVPNKYGELLVVQEENVIIIDTEGIAQIIHREAPLAGWTSHWIDDDRVAVGSNLGILIINRHTLKLEHRVSSHLGKSGWQFTSTNSLYIDSNGQFFCGINAGLFKFDFPELKESIVVPQPKVDSINWINTTPQKKNNTYQLGSGKWSLRAAVFTSWFYDEKQIRFRFKLVGFDQGWSDLSEAAQIRYNSVPSGDYSLLCQVYSPVSGFGDPVTIMQMRVTIPILSAILHPFLSFIRESYHNIFHSKLKNLDLLARNSELQEEIIERKSAQLELQHYKSKLEGLIANRTRALQIEKEKAESADKMKSEFLARMSHEIRTPIGGIIGLNNILASSDLNDQQSDYVSKIKYSAEHLLDILNDILDITKIEAGKMELEKIPFSIKKLISEVETIGKIKAEEKNIDFLVDLQVEATNLIGDPLRLKQILFNLINNSVKFTEEGSVLVSIHEINRIRNTVVLLFEVSDSGIGMTEEQTQKLFKAFQQADSSISRKYGGTGLGLNISYKFVEMMNSKLKVKSEVAKGSTFYFTIQLEEVQDAILIDGNFEDFDGNVQDSQPKDLTVSIGNFGKAGINSLKGCRILVAEDNQINQLIIKKMLIDAGMEVHVTADGRACVNELKNNSDYDLVLMDIQMPKLDGYEAAAYIRNVLKFNEIKIIALTAHALSGTREKILESGMNDYLTKPLDKEKLFETLIRWIKKKPTKSIHPLS